MKKQNYDYTIIIEEGENSFGAYVPDLPGCVAVAKDIDTAIQLIQEGIQIHIEGMLEDGLEIPIPSNVKDCIRKDREELKKYFQKCDSSFKYKKRKFVCSYVVPTKEENEEIRKLIAEIKKEDKEKILFNNLKWVKPKR